MTGEKDEAVGNINIFLRHIINLRRINNIQLKLQYINLLCTEKWTSKASAISDNSQQTRHNTWTLSFQKVSTYEVVNATRGGGVHMDSSREHGKHDPIWRHQKCLVHFLAFSPKVTQTLVHLEANWDPHHQVDQSSVVWFTPEFEWAFASTQTIKQNTPGFG